MAELGRDGIAEVLGREGIEADALGLCAGIFGIAFLGLLAEALQWQEQQSLH